MDSTEPPYSQSRFEEIQKEVAGFIKKVGYAEDMADEPVVVEEGRIEEMKVTQDDRQSCL